MAWIYLPTIVYKILKNEKLRSCNSERSNEYAHPSYNCRTELIPKVGRFDTRYKISADIDWIIRLENSCENYQFDPKPLLKMTLGGNSASCPPRLFMKNIPFTRNSEQGGSIYSSSATMWCVAPLKIFC